jgi:hypothetical protein
MGQKSTTTLKADTDAAVFTNANEEITAAALNALLKDFCDSFANKVTDTLAVVHSAPFDNDDLDANNHLNVNHGLGRRPMVQVIDNTGQISGIQPVHSLIDLDNFYLPLGDDITGQWELIYI